MTTFEVGDLVRVTDDHTHVRWRGKIGTIVKNSSDGKGWCFVDIYDPPEGKKRGEGSDGEGFHFNEKYLEHV